MTFIIATSNNIDRRYLFSRELTKKKRDNVFSTQNIFSQLQFESKRLKLIKFFFSQNTKKKREQNRATFEKNLENYQTRIDKKQICDNEQNILILKLFIFSQILMKRIIIIFNFCITIKIL